MNRTLYGRIVHVVHSRFGNKSMTEELRNSHLQFLTVAFSSEQLHHVKCQILYLMFSSGVKSPTIYYWLLSGTQSSQTNAEETLEFNSIAIK